MYTLGPYRTERRVLLGLGMQNQSTEHFRQSSLFPYLFYASFSHISGNTNPAIFLLLGML